MSVDVSKDNYLNVSTHFNIVINCNKNYDMSETLIH